MVNNLLLKAEERIGVAYTELSHDQGWSFLYTPGATLNSQSRFLFMGLNPGGEGERNNVSLTTEKGNAYHPEVENDWLGNGQAAPLQTQVVKFYEMLGCRLGYDAKKLMDSTLAANFCPYRSPSWNALKEKDRTISFCVQLWTELFLNLELTTIVCMSSLVYDKMSSIIAGCGSHEMDRGTEEVGWGKVKYYYKTFKLNDRDIYMICLPHLSRYKIFSSQKCAPQVDAIVRAVAASLSDWVP